MRGHTLEFARIGRENDPAQASGLRAKCFVESRRRIQAGTDRCTALRQNGQPRQCGLDARDAVADLARKRIKGLSHRHRYRVHQMGAADLDGIGKRIGLCREFILQAP